jgi:hypothetical protein
MLPDNLIARLSTQLDALPMIIEGASEDQLAPCDNAASWTAHDNLAHLARYQEVFLVDRCQRILHENNPTIARYRAENDPDWPSWRQRTTGDVVDRLRTGRNQLATLLGALSASDWHRVGSHVVFGPLQLLEWVEFFLIHEGHHLYVAWLRSRE